MRILLLLLAILSVAQAQQPSTMQIPETHACQKDPAYHRLDFWLGEWEVFAKDDKGAQQKDGDNRIEKILDGCAIVENWKDVDGHEGKSLFYYRPVQKDWKQVWVTDVGPMKEKTLILELPNGGVRFQGELAKRSGGSYLDRTTLTPLPDGKVRQVIEMSLDGGKSWNTGFDAEYRKK
jgi:hypothetical protein